jgi:hypothetical protein
MRDSIRVGLAVSGLLTVLGVMACSRGHEAPAAGNASTGKPVAGKPAASNPSASNASAGIPSAGNASTAPPQSTLPKGGPCGDERDKLIEAYKDDGIGLKLTCDDFTQSRHTEFFGFSVLTGHGGFKWALLRDPMLVSKDKGYGLDLLREDFGGERQINDAYRDPVHNTSAGGALRSRHMFGDAADVRNVTRSRQEWDRMWSAAQKADADYIEPINGPCKLSCLHADWRNHEGEYR